VFARYVSKETFGTYQYLLSFFSIVTAFTLLGMNTAVIRAVAQGYEGTMRTSVTIQLKYGIVPFLIAAAGALYYWHAGNLFLAMGLLIIGICTAPLYAFNTYGALLVGRKDFKSNTLISLVANTLYYSALCGAALLSDSPLVILGVNLGIQVIMYFIIYRFVLRRYRPNDKVDTGALSYGLHLSAMSVFGSVAAQVGSVLTFHFLGPAALALFGFASAIPGRLAAIFFKFLGDVALPKFAKRTAAEIRALLWHKMLVAYGVGFVLAIISAASMPFLFSLLFPTYTEAVPYAMFICIGIFLGAANFLPHAALTALQRTRELYIINIANPIASIIFPLIGILLFDLWGLVVSGLITILFSVILSTTLVYTARE
jgi:O-antigen/teichoic acid export membrane protein